MANKLLVSTNLEDDSLYKHINALDQDGQPLELWAITERLLTIVLNGREAVTAMTIGDHPECLAVGFLLNQRLLEPDDVITSIKTDMEDGIVLVEADMPDRNTDETPKRRIHTSGCALGTLFGGVMESLDEITLDQQQTLRSSDLRNAVRKIEAIPSLHKKTGSVHRCVLCEDDQPLIYMEDVGRHNAIDKIAGYMHLNGIDKAHKYIYATGRLTSEVIIKTAIMGIPVLVSRSGFSALGIELARQTGLTLIGRCRGRNYQLLSGSERVIFDSPESEPHQDKTA